MRSVVIQDDHIAMMFPHHMQDDMMNMHDIQDIISLTLDTYLCQIFVSKKKSSINAISIGLYHSLIH